MKAKTMNPSLIKTSKFISMVLRHSPDRVGLNLDPEGWVLVDDLINAIRISRLELDEIIKTNNKKRFELKDNGKFIRACQGHTAQIDLNLSSTIPPDVLYHGTCEKFVNSILNSGIQKMKRNHVHLSKNKIDATKVGSRHGKPIILEINAKKMVDDGILFYVSTNEVWLTEFVDRKYIKVLSDDSKIVSDNSNNNSNTFNNLF